MICIELSTTRRMPRGSSPHSRWLPILALLSLFAAACGGDGDATPATALVLSVRSDLGGALQEVELRVAEGDENPDQTDAKYRKVMPVESDALPVSLVITRGESSQVSFAVRALGDGGTLLTEYRAKASFSDGQSLRVPVFLASSCVGRACLGTQVKTCYPSPSGDIDAGACGPVPTLDDDALQPITTRGDEHDWDPPDAACDPDAVDGECSLFPQCGCDGDETCRYDADADELACSGVGNLQTNAACDAARECGPGLTCYFGMCLPYCAGDADCGEGGACVPVTGNSGGQVAGVNVCFTGCDPRAEESVCGGGSMCAQAEEGRFCLAPITLRDPCPFENDGECDEPEGTGVCAEGTDAQDCCAPAEDVMGECNLQQQCGCGEGEMCTFFAESTQSGPQATAVCADAGSAALGEPCGGDAQCQPGLACIAGLCKPYCETDSDCQGLDGGDGVCDDVTFDGEVLPGVRTCYLLCDFDANTGCADGTVCADLPTPECHLPLTECPDALLGNGTCDEDVPGGTRLCAPGGDPDDCADVCPISNPPGGECDLVSQCGCGGGQDCTILVNDFVPACRPVSGTVAAGGPCDAIADCQAGSVCYDSLCLPFCREDADCDGVGPLGGACTDVDPDANGGVGSGVAVCVALCDPDTGTGCTAPAVCPNYENDNRCVRPRDPCPDDWQEDGVCDEPEGTRYCAEGTDVVDCMP